MTYKTITLTIKDEELNAQLHDELFVQHVCPLGNDFESIKENPQNLIRRILHNEELVSKAASNMYGDRSCWHPGDTIKLSLYKSDADYLRLKANELGVKVQLLIQQVLSDFFSMNPPTQEVVTH